MTEQSKQYIFTQQQIELLKRGMNSMMEASVAAVNFYIVIGSATPLEKQPSDDMNKKS